MPENLFWSVHPIIPQKPHKLSGPQPEETRCLFLGKWYPVSRTPSSSGLCQTRCMVHLALSPHSGLRARYAHPIYRWENWGFMGLPRRLRGKESTCNAENLGSIPGSGRSLEEGNGYPLQYSYLGNPMDRGACGLTVCNFERRMQLVFLTFYFILEYSQSATLR